MPPLQPWQSGIPICIWEFKGDTWWEDLGALLSKEEPSGDSLGGGAQVLGLQSSRSKALSVPATRPWKLAVGPSEGRGCHFFPRA